MFRKTIVIILSLVGLMYGLLDVYGGLTKSTPSGLSKEIGVNAQFLFAAFYGVIGLGVIILIDWLFVKFFRRNKN